MSTRNCLENFSTAAERLKSRSNLRSFKLNKHVEAGLNPRF